MPPETSPDPAPRSGAARCENEPEVRTLRRRDVRTGDLETDRPSQLLRDPAARRAAFAPAGTRAPWSTPRVLVFLSDLHLTDGSTCATISKHAFAHFVADLEWMIRQACHRKGGKFKPLERVDLILLGDIFDLLRTSAWKSAPFFGDHRLRPWTPEMSPPERKGEAHKKLAAFITGRTRAIIRHNNGLVDRVAPTDTASGLECLRRLAEGGVHVTDPNDERTTRVPVRLWYMAGNHDWFYAVARSEYNEARRLLIDALTLENAADTPFPHTIDALPHDLRDQLRAHRVFAQHGDVYDPSNFQAEGEDAAPHLRRARSSLGDAIVIELIDLLEQDLLDRLSDDPIVKDRAFRQALKEIDNVRPLLAIPQWLSAVIQRFGAKYPAGHERRDALVLEVVKGRLEQMLRDPFVRKLDRPLELDPVDVLKAGEVAARFSTLDWLAWMTERFEQGRSEISERQSYREHALAQLNASSERFDYVVMGHTHFPDVAPLDLEDDQGRIYINTGTWRPIHSRCEGKEREFVSAHVMSYAAIYKDDERKGRRYETWTGTLGVGQEE